MASSSVMGIQTDAHLKGQDYSLLGTILYIGILIGEVSFRSRCFHVYADDASSLSISLSSVFGWPSC